MSQRVPVRPLSSPTLKQNSRDVFKYMVTPDRIPEFIIPSLDILQEHRYFGKEKVVSVGPVFGPWDENHSDPSPQKDCSWSGSLPCCAGIEMEMQVENIPDQVTRAAFSLPHLPKITTPYGFVALGESPHMTTEEALFSRADLASLEGRCTKRYSYPQVSKRCCDVGTPVVHMDVTLKEHCLQHALKVNRPSLPRRNSSPDRNNCGLNSEMAAAKDMDGASNSSASLAAVCPRRNSSPDFQEQKPQRNLLKKILKKHFAQRWSLKAGKFLAH